MPDVARLNDLDSRTAALERQIAILQIAIAREKEDRAAENARWQDMLHESRRSYRLLWESRIERDEG